MRSLLGVAVVFLAAAPGRGGEGALESLIKEALRLGEEAHKTLQAVKDRKSAEALRPKLADLSTRYLRVQDKLSALDIKSLKELAAVGKKYKEQADRMGVGINREIDRIAKDREAYAVIEEVGLVASSQNIRGALARVNVRNISRAVDAYFVANGQHPKALADLTRGDKPFLEAKALLDPWGRPYRYDPDTLNPKTGSPLVYSEGPQPGVPGSAIRNWTDEPKKK